MIWFIIILVAEIILFLLYVKYHKRYPILAMPFDNQYRVFKRAYRAYTPARKKKMQYHIFASDFLAPYKQILERGQNISSEKFKAANRIVTIIETRRELFESYFNKPFGYKEYLAMMSEYDLTEIQQQKSKGNSYTVPLFRKAIIFEALFQASGIDTDTTKKARFIRNLLEIETETEKIANTNIYKQLKKSKTAPETDKETKARIEDLEYVVNELKIIGLEKQSDKIKNEIADYKSITN